MKQIDLGPDDYKAKGPDGRWRVKDDPRILGAGFAVSLVVLGLIWWNRDALTSGTLFGVTAMFAVCVGGFFALLTKDRY